MIRNSLQSRKTAEKILLIDDERHVTDLLKILLRKAGYEVRSENVSWRALATAEQFSPDLIIMDLNMPEVDGGRLAALMEGHPALKDVPIIFLTGAVTTAEVARRNGQFGGAMFVAKPFCGQELLGRISEALAARLDTGLMNQENGRAHIHATALFQQRTEPVLSPSRNGRPFSGGETQNDAPMVDRDRSLRFSPRGLPALLSV